MSLPLLLDTPKYLKTVVYQNLVEIFYEKNQLNEAFNWYQQVIKIFHKIWPINNLKLIYIE